ncbi:MAG: YeeE/YedE thiosulfate transporter family protein [Gemmatimonadales bacterium]
MNAPKRYSDPILAGVALGLVLLSTILVTGRGLGASGAFASAAAATINTLAPAHAASVPYLAERVPSTAAGIFGDWLVIELLAVAMGAWLSARFANRLQWRGADDVGDRGSARIVRAIGGGALMGVGARLAQGCTSGLALTGGAMLSTGAWLFIPVAFGSAFAAAYVMRQLTRRGQSV